jgi:hypothetical protein
MELDTSSPLIRFKTGCTISFIDIRREDDSRGLENIGEENDTIDRDIRQSNSDTI